MQERTTVHRNRDERDAQNHRNPEVERRGAPMWMSSELMGLGPEF